MFSWKKTKKPRQICLLIRKHPIYCKYKFGYIMRFRLFLNHNLFLFLFLKILRDVLFRRAYDYHLLKLELKRLSSNEFIVTLCLTIIILLNQEFKPFRVSNYKICLEYLHSYLKTAFHNENSNEEGFEDVQAMDTSDPTLHQNPTTRPTIYQVGFHNFKGLF
jgi:hypothetical protein